MLIAKRNNLGGAILPYARRLAYVECNGSQYLKSPIHNVLVDDEFEATFVATKHSGTILGAHIVGSVIAGVFDEIDGGKIWWKVFNDSSAEYYNNIGFYNRFSIGFAGRKNYVRLNDGERIYIGNIRTTKEITLPLTIFYRNGVANSYCNGARCYDFYHMRDGKLICHLIPVMSYEGNPEMFDEVTQTFAERHGKLLYGELDGGGV